MTNIVVLIALAAQAQPAGVAPAWDTGKLFAELTAQSKRMQPILQQVKPQEWNAMAEQPGWIALWQGAVRNNRSVGEQSQTVAQAPERLAESLRLLMTLERTQSGISELLEGVRKYQNPALAELIAGIQKEGKDVRQAYEQRVVELANEREEQCSVADHEAQRCREMLSKSPRTSHGAVK